jgi:hypothetical protein
MMKGRKRELVALLQHKHPQNITAGGLSYYYDHITDNDHAGRHSGILGAELPHLHRFLTKEPKLLLNDNNAGKAEGTHLMIGRRPMRPSTT